MLYWDDDEGYTHTFDLKLLNLPENAKYCLIEIDRVNFKGCKGCMYSWYIENLKLEAPIENGFCRFKSWKMVEPEKATYTYLKVSPDWKYEKTYMNCQERDCWNFLIPEAQEVSGKLTILTQSPTQPSTKSEEEFEEMPELNLPQEPTIYYKLTETELEGKIYLACKAVETCDGSNCFKTNEECVNAMNKRIEELKNQGKEVETIGIFEEIANELGVSKKELLILIGIGILFLVAIS